MDKSVFHSSPSEENEKNLQSLFNTVTDFLWVLDGSGTIIHMNKTVVKRLGYTREELLGNSVLMVHPEERRGEAAELVKQMLEGKADFCPIPIVAKDGKSIQVETRIIRGQWNGNPAIFGVSRDISDRMLSEEKLLELNRTKDKFMAIIAHDLKSPFNVILGFSELLRDSIREGNLEKAERYTATIHDASEQAVGFLVNLLEWARTQMDGLSFNPEILGVERHVNETAGLLNYQATAKNLTLEFDIEPGLLVNADRNMLRTILVNLVSNAIKFSRPGCKIKVKAALDNRYVEFIVSDRGTGIRKEHMNLLFRLDKQYTTTGTQEEKGSGLGLLLCKDFVEKHGGKIWVNSDYGKGSAFYFTIPGSRMPEIN
jgi:PAS domain S-box-containing protein